MTPDPVALALAASPFQLIPIADIDASGRLRPVDAAWVEALAVSIEAGGLAGAHRLAAVTLLNEPEIPAVVIPLDPNQARLAEIDENLMRHELTQLDRAVFLAERKRVWEALYPLTAHGKAKKHKQNQDVGKVAKMATFPRFTKEAAERTGLSERTSRRSIALVADLGPDLIAGLRGTVHADDATALQLFRQRLGVATPEQRATVLSILGRGGTAPAREVLRQARLAPDAPPEESGDALFAKIDALWARMGKRDRDRWLSYRGLAYAEKPAPEAPEKTAKAGAVKAKREA
jgi:ParB family transcriptional regulator, chromosome partitioning protein